MCREISEPPMEVKVDIEKEKGEAPTWEVLLEGRFIDGDCGSDVGKPTWFDQQKYDRGAHLLRDNLLSTMFCHLAGLILGISIQLPFTVLSSTGQHGTMKSLATRYLATSKKVISWYETDIFNPSTDGAKSLAVVRKMHGAAHRAMNRLQPRDDGEKWLSQFYMATTQISFVGFMCLFPKSVGLGHLREEDFDCIIHYWRCIGYLLGMSDRYNICSGSLADAKRLTQNFIDHLLKPSMVICTPDKFKLGQAILEAILISTKRRLVTFNGFIIYWCNLIGVNYVCKMSLKDRICLIIFSLMYASGLNRFSLVRKLQNYVHHRNYRIAFKTISKEQCPLPDELLDNVYPDISGCPFHYRSDARQERHAPQQI